MPNPFGKSSSSEDRFLRTITRDLDEALGRMKMPKTAAPLEIQQTVAAAIREAHSKWNTSMLSDYTALIIDGIKYVGSPAALGIDANAMAALMMRDTPLWGTYADMSAELSRELNAIIIESFANPSVYTAKKVLEALRAKARDLTRSRLERIARTESQAVSMKGREIAWKTDDDGTRTYQFLHGNFKICELCEAIVKDIGPGKTMVECKEIIKRRSMEYMGPRWKPRDWIAHPNCNGALVRTSIVQGGR